VQPRVKIEDETAGTTGGDDAGFLRAAVGGVVERIEGAREELDRLLGVVAEFDVDVNAVAARGAVVVAVGGFLETEAELDGVKVSRTWIHEEAGGMGDPAAIDLGADRFAAGGGAFGGEENTIG